MDKVHFSFGGGETKKLGEERFLSVAFSGLFFHVSFAAPLRDEIDIFVCVVFVAIPLAERQPILTG